MICKRCGKETDVWTVSMFNTEECCLDCINKEKQHPDYERAREEENRQCRLGNFNFEGIGKPADL